jgi:hypothetical protein
MNSGAIWVGFLLSFAGILFLLSSAYSFRWIWRLAKWGYLPKIVGEPITRVIYLVTGFSCFAGGIEMLLSLRLYNNYLSLIVSFALSTCLSVIIFNLKKGQVITDIFKRKFYKK